MPPTPTGLSLDAGQLVIEWSDGQCRRYAIADLRQACPCATCLSQAGEGPVLPADLSILVMEPAGNYAYRIEFSDGHGTGIFPLELLRSLGQPTE